MSWRVSAASALRVVGRQGFGAGCRLAGCCRLRLGWVERERWTLAACMLLMSNSIVAGSAAVNS